MAEYGTQPRMGFFTDTSVCIGCKACEVACKEWNGVPEAGGLDLLGHVVRQHRRPRREHLAARGLHRTAETAVGPRDARGRRTGTGGPRRAVADVERRLQALHARRVPRRLPDRRAVPDRVRHRRRAAGHLQRLRLLRARLPVRRHRKARERRPRVQVHALLRPPRRGLEPACAKACPTDSIQFGELDELRRARRGSGGRPARGRQYRKPGSTATTRTTASAVTARSSCCWTNPRSTGCRRIRSSRPATCPRCGSGRR